VVQDIKAGEELTLKNLRAIRPGLGLPTKYLHQVLGKKVNRNISKGYAFSLNMIG
jgi:sialic acid synthase SpsE